MLPPWGAKSQKCVRGGPSTQAPRDGAGSGCTGALWVSPGLPHAYIPSPGTQACPQLARLKCLNNQMLTTNETGTWAPPRPHILPSSYLPSRQSLHALLRDGTLIPRTQESVTLLGQRHFGAIVDNVPRSTQQRRRGFLQGVSS